MSGLTLPDALDALVAYELDIDGMEDTLTRAIAASDPALAPRLKAVVNAYGCSAAAARLALVALRLGGEPADYFLGLYDSTATGKRYIVGYEALGALAARPDVRTYEAVRPLLRWGGEGPPTFNHARPFETALALSGVYVDDPLTDITHVAAIPWFGLGSVVDQAYRDVRLYTGKLINGAVFDVAADTLLQAELVEYRPFHAATLHRVREWARTNPSAVEAAIDRLAADYEAGRDLPNVFAVEPDGEDGDLTPAMWATAFGDLIASLRTAVPALTAPVPVDLQASVVPVGVCVAEPGPWRFAEFSYAYAGSGPVQIPHGPSNRLSEGDGDQPEIFHPSGEPVSWRTPFDGQGRVTWTLLGQSVTADSTTPRCELRGGRDGSDR